MRINTPSDLLIAGEQACNNEDRLYRWKQKKIKLAIAQRRLHISQNELGTKGMIPSNNLHFRHH